MRYRLYILIAGVLLVFLILGTVLYRDYSQSFFSSTSGRINIGVWGEHTYVLSLGKTTRQHYIFIFENSHVIDVPGGLKSYKIGALGKLAYLENDPNLFVKALSQGSGIIIHKALYKDTDTIYYDEEESISRLNEVMNDLQLDVLKAGDLNLFDRIFVYTTLAQARPSQINVIKMGEEAPKVGALLDKAFRNEKKLVQILFVSSESTAVFLSKMLENTGIRVADISQGESDRGVQKCSVVESGTEFSQTSIFMSTYFGCSLVKGNTGLYEVQWRLDTPTEEKWRL